jgi:hypothetical protein
VTKGIHFGEVVELLLNNFIGTEWCDQFIPEKDILTTFQANLTHRKLKREKFFSVLIFYA